MAALASCFGVEVIQHIEPQIGAALGAGVGAVLGAGLGVLRLVPPVVLPEERVDGAVTVRVLGAVVDLVGAGVGRVVVVDGRVVGAVDVVTLPALALLVPDRRDPALAPMVAPSLTRVLR